MDYLENTYTDFEMASNTENEKHNNRHNNRHKDKDKDNNNQTNTNTNTNTTLKLVMMLVVIVGILIVNYLFYKGTQREISSASIANPQSHILMSLFLTLVFPIASVFYNTYYHIQFQKTHTKEEELEELQEEAKLLKESKVPIILFGLGVFITKLEKKYIRRIFPYLLASLIFGNIFIEVVNHLNFDFQNLRRMIIFEEIGFASLMLSYGFLVMSIYLTYIYFASF